MTDECPRCREYAARGGLFCGACGRPLADVQPPADPVQHTVVVKHSSDHESLNSFLSIILLVACVGVMIVSVFELATVLANSGDVFSFLDDKYLSFILIIPFPYAVFSVGESALQVYWILIILVISMCVVTAAYKFIKEIRSKGGISEPGSAENTAFFWVCVSLSAMLLINVIIVLLTEASGSQVEVPDFGDVIDQIFLMANAAVWEEIIARLLYIGVPMAIISLIATKKLDSWKCLVGGFGMSKAAIIFIIVSGIIFGLAHYPGWENQAWKVVATGIMGMFLGYVFVRFGLYASIVLHFINNYLSSFDWMGIGGVGGLVTVLLVCVGFIAIIYIIMRLVQSGETLKRLPLFRNGYIKDH